MENYCNFKPFDKVLVRYDDQHVWQIDFFSHYVRGVECPYKCLTRDFNQCIPYEGNEHLLGTTNTPERCNPDKDTLFGIKLKPGYVIDFQYTTKMGVVFPTKRGLAIAYVAGSWQSIDSLEENEITCIRDIADHGSLLSGEVLWERPTPQTLTKAEIAKKLGMSVQDFEITDEENEENE